MRGYEALLIMLTFMVVIVAHSVIIIWFLNRKTEIKCPNCNKKHYFQFGNLKLKKRWVVE